MVAYYVQRKATQTTINEPPTRIPSPSPHVRAGHNLTFEEKEGRKEGRKEEKVHVLFSL